MKILNTLALALTLFVGTNVFAKGEMPPPIGDKDQVKEQEQAKEQEQEQATEQEQVKEEEGTADQEQQQGQEPVAEQEQVQEQEQAAEQQQGEAGQQTGEMTTNPLVRKWACIARNPHHRGMRFIGSDLRQLRARAKALGKCRKFSDDHRASCRITQCLRVH